MRLLPSSPRRRRRLAWLAALAALASGVAALVILMAPPTNPTMSPRGGRGFLPPPEPEQVRPSRQTAAAALSVASDFVRTAVARRNVGSSWGLVTPSLRAGYTRANWAEGEIPVVPFPVREARWRVEYSYADEIGFQVALFPPPRSQVRATVFDLTMKAVGRGTHRRWLVDSFMPGPLRAPASRGGRASGLPDLGADRPAGDARLGRTWLLLPFGVLGLALVVPLAVVLVQWYRGHRARRAYAADRRP